MKEASMGSKPLPSRLAYLQPALDWLATLPADELDEDTDSSLVDNALRTRISGMSESEAQQLIDDDGQALEGWLDQPGMELSPGNFILGLLSLPDLAHFMLVPPEPPPPRILFEAPDGYQIVERPNGLNLEVGLLIGCINVIDVATAEFLQEQKKQTLSLPHVNVDCSIDQVCFGPVIGTRHRLIDTVTQWKRVEYFLDVPGGHVYVMLDAGGKDFDEAPMEACLHTLRVEEPG